MSAIEVLRSATSVNAQAFGYSDKTGRIAPGLLADMIAVDADPSVDIKLVRKVKMVMKDGQLCSNKAAKLEDAIVKNQQTEKVRSCSL